MASLNTVRNAVDAQLVTLWPAVQAAQAAYFAAHRRFWQGRRTHLADLIYSALVDGSVAGDQLDGHPTDQNETWLDLFPSLAGLSLKAVLRMDVYESPVGHGYQATLRVLYNGVIYERSQNVGPETFRTAAWHIVTPDQEG